MSVKGAFFSSGSSISVVVPIQRRAGGSDAGDDPAEVYKYMLVDVTCQRYTVSTVFQLEKIFKTTFSSFVLHMGLVSRHLKEGGNDGVKFGQYIYTSMKCTTTM
uniref:Uncharacterized protein n=1 Tax=Zea mays TaxID=4577 RepID=C4IZQ8_MAIZE|nr:unknown [Zea mays]